MFIQVDDYNSTKTYAIVDGSMRTKEHYNNVVEYIFDAYWIVDSGKTKGSLAVGTLNISYCNDFAPEMNALDDYRNMSVDDVLGHSGDMPSQAPLNSPGGGIFVKPKETRAYAHAIFGNGKAWVEGRGNGTENDLIFKNLVETWFNLPQLPSGTSRWMKFKK